MAPGLLPLTYLLLSPAVGFPLTVLGGILGKNMAGGFDAPCRTKNIAREIPPSPWYRSMTVHMAIGGFLPFRSVPPESGAALHLVFCAWHYLALTSPSLRLAISSHIQSYTRIPIVH